MTSGGPGYRSPMDAVKFGPREKILYVTTVQPNIDIESNNHGDYLATVDVDPSSPTYCQIIYRTFTHSSGNELHHSGWNTCSSCFVDGDKKCAKGGKRDKLILPCLLSNRIFIVDTKNERAPEMFKTLESADFFNQKQQRMVEHYHTPHTTHCLPNGCIMISTMGTNSEYEDGAGQFILLNSNFDVIGKWAKNDAKFGYDYWYQPYYNVMVSSEWASPKLFKSGFAADHLNRYGRSLNFYNWSDRKLFQTIDLGLEGAAPLETRFFHNPKRAEGFVGCAVFANVFRFYKHDHENVWAAEKVIDVPPIKISGWKNAPPPSLENSYGMHTEKPDLSNQTIYGMMTDIIISLDDRFLYFSNWLHGDVRQYDVTDPKNPILKGQVFLGGVLANDDDNSIMCGSDVDRPKPVFINGRRLYGGPQMLQLSLDGKRLYVSSSLFSPWDKQFYPKMVETGGWIAQLDVDTELGGMKLNESFLVDFGKEPYGPTLPHEMRYPGGDCTSDIWLAGEEKECCQ